LLQLLDTTLLGASAKTKLIHERLIEVLREASTLIERRERLARAAFDHLLRLSSRAGTVQESEFSCHVKVARLALTTLVKRSRQVLQQFVIDDKRSGKMPTTRARLLEVVIVLQLLHDLQLHPSVTEGMKGLQHGPRSHLFQLFSLLCDCITTQEMSIKEQLKALFHVIGRDLDLE
jgi:hypothetical protein